MSDINKQALNFAVKAYRILKNDESTNASFFDINTDNGYINFIMIKKHWYYGEYILFSGASKVCSFDKSLLEELSEVKQAD